VSERRDRAVKLASAIGFLALAAVAVLIVISQSQSGGGDAGNIEGGVKVGAMLRGVPQERLVLGEPRAAVTLVEFGDLQCPVCKGYSEEVIPQIVEGPVRRGDARLDFRNYTIIGAESVPAAAAAIAAGDQGRGWNFIELFYRNQGEEASGYVSDEFLTAIARAAGVRDIAAWDRERKSARALLEVKETTGEAKALGFTGTPSFAIEGPGTNGLEALGTPGSAGDLEASISAAAEHK
jgi:protein-disulfide isomerase